MTTGFELLLPALAGAACAAVALRLERSRSPGPTAVPAWILVVATVVTFCAVFSHWLGQTTDPWNAARLAPLVAVLNGVTFYQPLNEGPVYSTVVGPVAFLFYLPAAVFAYSPSALILAAVAQNLIVFAALGWWILHRSGLRPAHILLVLMVAAQIALVIPALRYSLFCIHADAPALVFVLLGVALLGDGDELSWQRALGVALAFTLATWAKQSVALAFPAAFAVLLLKRQSGVARLLVASIAVGGIISVGIVATLGWDRILLNMFQIPARHPWMQMSLVDGAVFPGLHTSEPLGKLKVLVAAALQIVRGAWPLWAGAAALLAWHWTRRRTGDPALPAARWATCLVFALALVPTSALGRIKVGGEVNHESFSLFFLVFGLLLWVATARIFIKRRSVPVSALAAILALLSLGRLADYPGWRIVSSNQNETSFNYERAHQGRVYFPWNPLAALIASKQAHHFDYGVFDRELGGAMVSADHIRQALPHPRPLIASFPAHHDYILGKYFPDYVERPADPELPGWRLYGPP